LAGEPKQCGVLSRPSPRLKLELILEKCSDFADFQVWPLRARMDPRLWLKNFDEADQEVAHHLLNAFMFFSPDLTAQLFTTAIQNLSTSRRWREHRPGNVFEEWRRFLRRLTVTHVTGEVPKATDSGQFVTRLARDRVGVPEEQILSPAEALSRRLLRGDDGPLIFVDDFMGAGEQFMSTWRQRHLVGGKRVSFEDVAVRSSDPMADWEIYFVPAICTARGLAKLADECPVVEVSAGNVLDEKYSVFHESSIVWPEELAEKGRGMIERVSRRLRLPEDGDKWDYRGFRRQGLAIGFDHKIPDATIPLFRLNRDDWKPLVRGA
jgi:hypothetical protein